MNEQMLVITSDVVEEFMINQLMNLRNWNIAEAKSALETIRKQQPVYDNLYQQASDILFESAATHATRCLLESK